tara:strand:+ start:89 stop:724 length:636 start_codon:yes stop_codon:yes gene_type:complete
MDNLTVPIGLPIEIKKSGAPDTQGIILQEFKYPFVAKKYNLFEEEKRLVWPKSPEWEFELIDTLNWSLEKVIKEFRDEKVNQKQKEQNLDNYHMTDYKSHLHIKEFDIISRLVLDNFCPKEHNFRTEDCWGALYKKGHYIKTHHHWPSALSWTYYLKTSSNTEPFVFVGQEKEYSIYPEEGDLIVFPSVMNHRVSVSQTDDERIVIVGNIR